MIGALLSGGVFLETRSRERSARRLEFARRAAQLSVSVKTSFDLPLEVLRSIPALFDASTDVTRAEFRAFVRSPLENYPWIYALEWIPRVPGDQRASFETAAVADGLDGYHFKEDAPVGAPVPARTRPEYFPLYYMEPPNRVALGIDEPALELRRLALERARDLDQTAITTPLKLVQDSPSVVSLIAFHPVWAKSERPQTLQQRRENLRGYAAVVFRIRPVVEEALRGVDLGALDVVLVDIDAKPPALLYRTRPGASEAEGATSWEQVASVAGRRWSIRVIDRAAWTEPGQVGWLALVVGLVASALAAALMQLRRTTVRLRHQIDAARRLGQYTLVEKLGEGGMGTVYRAHHALLRRPTAIKLLHAMRTSPSAHARFELEVQLTSSLSHPNTVTVYDYGHSPDGVFYYAMEYIEGITLQELVDVDGPQPAARVLGIVLQICAALAEAHAIGLVHRDIKPANVMLCQRAGIPDFVKVLDFGLAKDLSGSTSTNLSQSTALLGTPLYLPPEAILGRTIDARTDIYAVGALTYFLLTGTPVFTGNSVIEICGKHISLPPEPISRRLGRELAPGLESLVLRCLAKDPADRPASVGELAAALGALGVTAWNTELANRWWQERGDSVVQRVRAARPGVEPQPRDHSLQVAPDRDVHTTGEHLG